VAEQIVAKLDVADMCEPAEIAGPGFINLRLSEAFLARSLEAIHGDERLGIPKVSPGRRAVVDFSSPNIAKDMHVGHLRTTIVGDSIARMLEFAGHEVLRINHVGDWGTQFGMLIQFLRESQPQALKGPKNIHIADLDAFYQQAKQRFDADKAFADAARRAVVDLQGGDPATRAAWAYIHQESRLKFEQIYDLLNIHLIERGESFYNDLLPGVVEEMKKKKLAVVDEGAVCVFLDGFVGRDGTPLPMIIQKSDGGFNYDTTDLAALKYRVERDKADWLIYVTDSRQHQHFEMLFACGRKAGWAPAGTRLDHVGYGMIMGPHDRPFRTREGGTVKLQDLLDEAISRARTIVDENSPDLPEQQRQAVGQAVGIGAVKYADLSHNVASDYRFSWDKMLAMDGNTAPYMMYAYARIRSIGRKGGIEYESLPGDIKIDLTSEWERKLAKRLLQYPDIFLQTCEELAPNVLTGYLFDTAQAFSHFYRECPVLQAESEALKLSRFRLCDIVARTIKSALHLLGIET
ncbi:unnamed protein product, partial [marine sediment metagenome]